MSKGLKLWKFEPPVEPIAALLVDVLYLDGYLEMHWGGWILRIAIVWSATLSCGNYFTKLSYCPLTAILRLDRTLQLNYSGWEQEMYFALSSVFAPMAWTMLQRWVNIYCVHCKASKISGYWRQQWIHTYYSFTSSNQRMSVDEVLCVCWLWRKVGQFQFTLEWSTWHSTEQLCCNARGPLHAKSDHMGFPTASKGTVIPILALFRFENKLRWGSGEYLQSSTKFEEDNHVHTPLLRDRLICDRQPLS